MKTDGEINRTTQNCSEFLNYKMNIMECEGLQTVQNNAILTVTHTYHWHTRLVQRETNASAKAWLWIFFKVLWKKQEGIE